MEPMSDDHATDRPRTAADAEPGATAEPGPAVAHRHLSQFEVGSPVVMSCASSQLRASGENVYAGGRSSA